jgi:hypothetical protein
VPHGFDDLLWVVLDPTGPRSQRSDLLPRRRLNVTLRVKNDRTRRMAALVNSKV